MIYKIKHIEKLECIIQANNKENALKKIKEDKDTETDILSIKKLEI